MGFGCERLDAAGGDGALVGADDARVSAFDHGVTVGDGVFETIKVLDGTPLALSRHLHRLSRSCDVLGLATPYNSSLTDAVSSVISSQPEAARLGRLRITVTAGLGPLGSDRGAGEGTTIVALASMNPWPATTSAIVVPWVRNERSAVVGAKTTSYAENVVALRWAHARGFSEGLFMNSAGTSVRQITCSSSSTAGPHARPAVGAWRESPANSFSNGMAIEGELPPSDLQNADEVFLTSSTRDIHPVLRLGDRQWETVGEVSRALSAQYVRRITQDVDP